MSIDVSKALLQIQQLLNGMTAAIPNMVLGILVLFIFYFISKWSKIGTTKLAERAHHGKGVGVVIGRLVQYCVWLLGILIALAVSMPSFRAKDIVQILGIGGVAIGFAFKEIFQNFLAGIIILITRPFRIGDQIVVKDIEGTVQDIKTRATTILTFDNKKVVVPNTILFTESVTVSTGYEVRRAELEVGLGYGVDIDYARKLILDAVSKVENVESIPAPDAYVTGLDSYFIRLRVRWWFNSRKGLFYPVQSGVLEAIYKTLKDANVDMPFPTTTVLLKGDSAEETPVESPKRRFTLE